MKTSLIQLRSISLILATCMWLGAAPRLFSADVTIVATDPIATEVGETTGTFTVSRTGPTTAALTVNYAQAPFTGNYAYNTRHYEALPGNVTIPIGQSSATITITPVDDYLYAPDGLKVTLNLTSGTGYTIGTSSSATVTILPPYHDVQEEFSAASNPSADGRWRYGWQGTLGGTFNIVTNSDVSYADDSTPLPYWNPSPGFEPAFFHNTANHTVTVGSGTVEIPPNAVFFSPGLDGYDEHFGVIRYTVQSGEAGTYLINGHVQTVYTNDNFGDSDFHVLVNGSQILRRDVENGGRATFLKTSFLSVGDTVDFVIGPGADESSYGSLLFLSAKLTYLTSSNELTRHEAGEEFDANDNPTSNDGGWSYGWKSTLTGPMTLINYEMQNYSDESIEILSWQLSASESPAVFWNTSSSQTATFGSGLASAAPNQVWFGPGQDETTNNYTVIRYTVPNGSPTGQFNGNWVICLAVDAMYRNIAAGDSDVHVMVNGVHLAEFAIPLGGWALFGEEIQLEQGDVIDFMIGRGADESEYGSQVKITAEVSRVSSWNLSL
jgi:hypothetical protein